MNKQVDRYIERVRKREKNRERDRSGMRENGKNYLFPISELKTKVFLA